MTREEFLARAGTAFDAGLITPARLRLLRDWTDGFARLEASVFGEGETARQQHAILERFLANERERLRVDERRGYTPTLANDPEGRALVDLTALLAHPCQACGTDPQAWWTRPAFCPHWRRKP